jgi:hypothetical protein
MIISAHRKRSSQPPFIAFALDDCAAFSHAAKVAELLCYQAPPIHISQRRIDVKWLFEALGRELAIGCSTSISLGFIEEPQSQP